MLKLGPRPLGTGVADAVVTHRSPCVILPNFVALGQTFRCNYGNSPENFDPLHPAFQGHSRSLEPTSTDWLPVTSY